MDDGDTCSQRSGPMSFDGENDIEESVSPKQTQTQQASQPMSVSAHQNRQYIGNGLRSIQEIPERYRHVFGEYPCFNRIQSMVLDTVFYSAEPLVVTAPTGSGKTVIFELAIVHLLISLHNSQGNSNDFKIVYMAPVKALCTEKLHEWSRKFSKLKVNCLEVTGDSDATDLNYLKKYQLILTTPEKWDSLTRRWKDHASLMKSVRLFLIDEVHLLNEEGRGPTLEAVVSRMKMLKQQQHSDSNSLPSLRFVAVSATIPNVEDLAQWLGSHDQSAKYFKIEEEMRPVKLEKVVKGYDSNLNGFMFDVHLSYKLKQVISQYSEGKPTLVFCSTRKSVLATADVLSKSITFSFTDSQQTEISKLSQRIVDNKIRELVKVGIGCHHAGMVMTDRNLLENAFRDSLLPVLFATSTLAMGVNLPAHLVVIKSTQFYGNGGYQDYSDSQLLQMMGRAGRPQFDTSATAVIMTKKSCEQKYVRLTTGTQPIQSSLHRHLVEHLNAEVVLGTVADLPAAVDWIRSTFLFVRTNRHPQHYGLSVPPGNASRINDKLQEMVQVELNALAKYNLVETNGMDVRDTPAGRLMARYYVAFETMKAFLQVGGEASLCELLSLLSQAAEFQDVQLRNDEKAALNKLNSKKNGAPGLRFPIKGRIKGRDCKVNCLLQALLGNVPITEPALQQEANRVVRTAERLSKCLLELVQLSGAFGSLLSAVLLHKCVRCQLWEDSEHAARQLPRIGAVLAGMLRAAGKTSLRAVAKSNPRDLERIVNRLPPFGDELRDLAARVPELTLCAELADGELVLRAAVANVGVAVNDRRHWVSVIVGDSDNALLVYDRFPCSRLLQGGYSNNVDVSGCTAETIRVHLISETWVGIDVEKCIQLRTPQAVPLAARKPAKRKSSFMDKVKEVASRMDDTPSYRLGPNQGLRNGDVPLSQRLEQFRRVEQVKRLPSLRMEELDDDPDDPTSLWPAARPDAAKEETGVTEGDGPAPWDDDWEEKPAAAGRVTGSRVQCPTLPNQTTIRSFFKPAATPVAPSSAAEPIVINLDDSWDMDIADLKCDSPTSPSMPGYVEKRAGCWNIDFDIGIDEFIEDFFKASDDEGEAGAARRPDPSACTTATEEVAVDFITWCEEQEKASVSPGVVCLGDVEDDACPREEKAVAQRGNSWADLDESWLAPDELQRLDGLSDAEVLVVASPVALGGGRDPVVVVLDSSTCSDAALPRMGSPPVTEVASAVDESEDCFLIQDESQDEVVAPSSPAATTAEPSERGPESDAPPPMGLRPMRDATPPLERGPMRDATPPLERGPVRDATPLFEGGPQRDATPQCGTSNAEQPGPAQNEQPESTPGQARPLRGCEEEAAPSAGDEAAIAEEGARSERSRAVPPDPDHRNGQQTEVEKAAQEVPPTAACIAVQRPASPSPLPVAAEANGRAASPASEQTFKMAGTEAPASSASLPSIARLSKTFNSVLAASKPAGGEVGEVPGNLLRFRPQPGQQATADSDADDAVTRLLAGLDKPRPPKRPLPVPLPAQAQRAATPKTHSGALSGAIARRGPTGIRLVTHTPPPAFGAAPDEELDFIERILEEGVPRRLLTANVKTVNLNTERLRAAGVYRGSMTVLSKELAATMSKGLSGVAAFGAASAPTEVGPSGGAAAPRAPEAVVAKEAAIPLPSGPGPAHDNGGTPLEATEAPREPCEAATGAAVGTARAPRHAAPRKGGCAAQGLLAAKAPPKPTSVVPSRAPPKPAAMMDWFERLLAEPTIDQVRRLSHPRPHTAKRKAGDNPLLPEAKRPPSMWTQLALPQAALPTQAASGRWGGPGSLSVTSTRSPPASHSPPPPASGDWQPLFDRSPRPSIGGESLLALPLESFLEPSGPGCPFPDTPASLLFEGRLDCDLSPDELREDVDDSSFQRSRGLDDDLDASFYASPPRDGSPAREDRDDQVVSASPSRSWDGDDDGQQWGDYHPDDLHGAPREHFVGDRFALEEDADGEGQASPVCWRPAAYHSPSYSPAPALGRQHAARAARDSFKWEPASLRSGAGEDARRPPLSGDRAVELDEDPFVYAPQATRPDPASSASYRAASAARAECRFDVTPTRRAPSSPEALASPALSLASQATLRLARGSGTPADLLASPAPGSKLVISLSPPPRKARSVTFSKWDTYLN